MNTKILQKILRNESNDYFYSTDGHTYTEINLQYQPQDYVLLLDFDNRKPIQYATLRYNKKTYLICKSKTAIWCPQLKMNLVQEYIRRTHTY